LAAFCGQHDVVNERAEGQGRNLSLFVHASHDRIELFLCIGLGEFGDCAERLGFARS
jgi:hypothetical protein